ncbi:MAG: LuxR C-terminal-related transcriptional regulator [Gemmatimonadales bacterium]
MGDWEGLRLGPLVMVILVAVVVGGITDLLLDAPTSLLSLHVLLELALILLSGGTAVFLARGWYLARRSLSGVQADLASRKWEREAWRASARKALEGLALEVDRQFAEWHLTQAERETALMLLKGFSLMQIARLAGRSERTVRQHAVAVYRKSGLAGRAELSGYFLGDLLLPSPRAS